MSPLVCFHLCVFQPASSSTCPSVHLTPVSVSVLCLSILHSSVSVYVYLSFSKCLSLSVFTCPSPYVPPSFSSCLSPSYLSPFRPLPVSSPFCLHLYVHFFAPVCLLPFSLLCIVGSLVGPVDGPVVTVVCPVRQRRCCPLLSGGALPGVVVPPGRVPAVLHQGASSQGQLTRPRLLAAAHSHTHAHQVE